MIPARALPPSHLSSNELTVQGRCTVAGDEFPCSARLADARIVRIACERRTSLEDIGTEAIAYLDGVGMVAGVIAGSVEGSLPGGFALAVAVSSERRARIERRLAWLRACRDGAVDRRSDPRIVPRNRATTLRWPDGSSSAAEILDLSMTGAGLAVAERPAIGWPVTVGKRAARVVRHTEDGIGVAFALPFSPQTFDEHAAP